MATLILYGDEKLEDIVTSDGETGLDHLYMYNIDVILHKKGKETKVLKSPNGDE